MPGNLLIWTNLFFAVGLLWNAFLFLIQAHKIKKTKHVSGVSLLMFLGFNVGQFLAILNGIAFHDPDLIYGFAISWVCK